LQRCLHVQRRADRFLGIILVCVLCAPHDHHRLADVFVDAAAVLRDDMIEPLSQRILAVGDILGVERFRQGRESGDIRKEESALAAQWFGRRDLCLQGCKFVAHRRERRLDDGLAL
jgi:hypothetical protein